MSDPDQYCRACKSVTLENCVKMTSDNFLDTKYEELFYECTGINIRHDEFSKILCETCVRALIFSHEFTQMCKKTQVELESGVILYGKNPEIVELDVVEDIKDDDDNMWEESDPIDVSRCSEEEIQSEKFVWTCDICQRNFLSRDSIKQHIEESHKEHKSTENLISCTKCDKIFSSKSVLNRHIRTIHENLRNFRCDMCDKSFKHKSNLTEHQAIHSEQRYFKCSTCELSFKTKTILQRHQRTHSDDFSHTCELCGTKFKSLTYLKVHHAIHTVDRLFICDMCEKSFKTQKTLTDHKYRVHLNDEKISCDICAKVIKKHNFKRHMRDHLTLGLPCNECHRRFPNTNLLNDHIAANHENNRSHICHYKDCESSYFTSSHLSYHIKSVHLGLQVRKK